MSARSFRGWQRVMIETGNGDIEGIAPVIVSASRATDIPAFYPDWFMHRLRAGFVRWFNKFNGQAHYVSFRETRAIVFWTKNAKPMMKHLPELDARGINYYFTYTVNDYEAEGVERNVPPLTERIEAFRRLSDTIGRERVVWRFDPLILTGPVTVDALLDKIRGVGDLIHRHTEKLVISFIDINLYRKVRQNLLAGGIRDCREFAPEDIGNIAEGLQAMNRQWGLEIATCSESADLSRYEITHNKCIDNELMTRLFRHDGALTDFLHSITVAENPSTGGRGKTAEVLKDPGQRKSCRCIPSKDIGQYDTCAHSCLYCYANTSPEKARSNYEKQGKRGQYGESILVD
ncbi:MAG: DUF1848 domain-containing protein [Chloroflexota bacterium]